MPEDRMRALSFFRRKRNTILLALIIAAALSGAVVFSADRIATFAWKNYRAARVALFFVRNDAELASDIGRYYFGLGGYDTELAKRAYGRAIAIEQKIILGHYELSRLYFVEGDHTRALREINTEIRLNPENVRALYVRGLIYGSIGDSEKAAEDFHRFTEWAPTEWAGYNDLSWALVKAGRYHEAGDAIRRALLIAPGAETNPWLWNSLGVAELNAGNGGGAIMSFTNAQTFAAELTEADWRASYPGNDPKDAGSGLHSFRASIDENLRRAEAMPGE
ncbi:MAG: hypothetical protein A3B29_05455 [Candidatus Sungbacteria bacterium RIFCSPLOWO2_01_FULL_51_34]|nr:MAG: hypothetical protein A3B29_05455 [Candidatus Sungbacteria bacterium RIFCSPLOWO2_01_FULL_51_34]